MFKVPEWGNDIPKGSAEVTNIFTNNKKKNIDKNNKKLNIKVNGLNGKTKKNKNNLKIGKVVNRSAQKTNKPILSKDDHIQNRITKRNLKNSSGTEAKATDRTAINNHKHNPSLKINDASSSIKTKVLKRKNKNKFVQKPEENNKNIIKDNNRTDSEVGVKTKKSRKRKHKQNDVGQNNITDNTDIQNYNSDEANIILVNAKRKKQIDKIKNEDVEHLLFGNKAENDSKKKKKKLSQKSNPDSEDSKDSQTEFSHKKTKVEKKKELIKKILQRDSNRNVINANGDKLRMRMMERLKAAQFRYLNEKLYTSSGAESEELFKSDPAAFQTYHEGFQQQVKKWLVNPLDLIVKRIQNMPKTHLIADMGCGEAALSRRVAHTVRSFDLAATAPGVEVCNMAHTPLLAASMDVVVYCLALMGTDLTQYLLEANRVLKVGGHLLIAEVESRFDNADTFCSDVQRLGFSLKKMDMTHKVFFFMEFTKVRDAPAKKNKLPVLSLKPCLYKRR